MTFIEDVAAAVRDGLDYQERVSLLMPVQGREDENLIVVVTTDAVWTIAVEKLADR